MNRWFYAGRALRHGVKGGFTKEVAPFEKPLLKLPAVFVGKFVRLFRLCMNRAEQMCKLSVYMKTEDA